MNRQKQIIKRFGGRMGNGAVKTFVRHTEDTNSNPTWGIVLKRNA